MAVAASTWRSPDAFSHRVPPWRRVVSGCFSLLCALVATLVAVATVRWAASGTALPAVDARLVLVCLVAALAAVSVRLAMLAAQQDRSLKALGHLGESFRDLCQNISEGVFRSTLDGRMTFANPSLARLNGYETEQQLLAGVNDIGGEWYVDPQRRAQIHAMLLEAGKVSGVVSEIYRYNTRERIWVEENTRLVRDSETGEPLYYDGTVREVSESVRRQELQDRYDKIASMVSGCLYQYRLRPDGSASVPYASIGLVHMIGLTPEAVVDDAGPLLEKIHRDDSLRLSESVLRSAYALSPWQCEFRVLLDDGTEKWLYGNSVPEREPDGSTLWHGFLTDVSERRRSEETINKLAYFDPLTELPNRAMLREKLRQVTRSEVATEQHHAILFIDLDNFKVLNDSKGHHAGDMLLCETARRLRACVRQHDVVARLGGDEFVLLLRDLVPDRGSAATHVRAVGEKILSALAEPLQIDGNPFQTTASIGVAVFREGTGDADEHLKHADLAMYEAKAAGRGTLRFFVEAMQERVAGQLALTSDLRNALAEGGLSLAFQPQVNRHGRWFGFEALLRWKHPTLGHVPPPDIIALADCNGLINNLEEWVLWEACRTLRSWSVDPILADFKLAVNISARQLNRPEFAVLLEHMFATTGADPARLTLELTESLRLDDIERVSAMMLTLKALGVSFALDDFGTGYSSLAYLRRLPIDILKIDCSFTQDLERVASDRVIVEAIVRIARSLGVFVIAEGVETAMQHTLLQHAGCTAFQGFAFGRPMALADIARNLPAAELRAEPSETRAAAAPRLTVISA